jgi:hypothetical protein
MNLSDGQESMDGNGSNQSATGKGKNSDFVNSQSDKGKGIIIHPSHVKYSDPGKGSSSSSDDSDSDKSSPNNSASSL